MSHYLYENGVIHTIPGRAQTDALLIRDGHVAAAGEEAREQAGHARRVDLAGRSIIPGFIDSHCHILSYGLSLLDLDVSPAAARSLADLQQRIAGAAGDWIVGRGYDPDRMAERRQLTRDDLDAAEPHRPVVLWHTSLHAVLCNSRALQRAGIGPDTANPPGSEIVRDTSGRATGVLTENAMGLIADKIPQPNQEQQVQAIVEAMRVMASQGITSASDAATGEGPEIEPTLELYRRALELTLPGRITLMPQIHYVAPQFTDSTLPPSAFDVGNRPDHLRIGATKIFSDGALTTRTAAVRRPYTETGGFGLLRWDVPVLNDMIARAQAAGWQIATHALGDRAVEIVLDAYQKAGPAGRRHRIEHYMMADTELVDRTARLGVVPNLQPDLGVLGEAYIAALGEAGSRDLIPVDLLRRRGVPFAFSSDRPVIPGAPLGVIRDAMERRTPGGIELGPENAVTALEGIYHYTAGGAYATWADDRLGTLEPGKLADLVILSADPAPADPDDLSVLETITGGDTVWEA